ncbi:DUF3181 family protein [Lyngbya confervoides]
MTSRDIEELAADIGRDVYIDVAKWHLYLADAHLHTVLAEQFAPYLEAGEVTEPLLQRILAEHQVAVGGGKRQIPLTDLLPVQSQVALMDILEEYQQG